MRIMTVLHRRAGALKHQFAIGIAVGALSGLIAWASPTAAQLITVPGGNQNQPPQNPLAGQTQPPQPTSGVPGSIITAPTTSGLTSSTPLPNPGLSLGSAGRGLPGMPGGPSINTPVGARDPSTSYMTPTVIGPLFCDPSINIMC